MMLKKSRYIICLLLATFLQSECTEGYIDNSANNNSESENCIPEIFSYNSSTQQAAYFFLVVTIDNESISNDDWVGAFNGDVCVGARKWDISQCGNGVCEVPVLGYDSELTFGYMLPGQIPTFKIFHASTLSYIDAVASEESPWFNFHTPVIQSLDALIQCDGMLDCAGICNGSAIVDECGICDSIYDSDCLQDCNGIWGGDSILDQCGICNGDNTACIDCNSDLYGTAYIDECGNCVGGNTGMGECLVDCLGIYGGDAIYDNCGVCDSNSNNNCEIDCAGIWGGDGIFDDCGICNGSGYIDNCGICDDNISNDGYFDQCGNCNSNASNDCMQDCLGIWGGESQLDICGVCQGDNSSCESQIPILFEHNISSLVAYYWFGEVFINFNTLSSSDWVGVFNGDICVGAKKWDTANCQNEMQNFVYSSF